MTKSGPGLARYTRAGGGGVDYDESRTGQERKVIATQNQWIACSGIPTARKRFLGRELSWHCAVDGSRRRDWYGPGADDVFDQTVQTARLAARSTSSEGNDMGILRSAISRSRCADVLQRPDGDWYFMIREERNSEIWKIALARREGENRASLSWRAFVDRDNNRYRISTMIDPQDW